MTGPQRRLLAIVCSAFTVLALAVGTGLAVPATDLAAVRAAPGAAQTRPPNILFVLLDDLDTHSVGYMPQVQALLAAQGVTFANMFVTYPLCCPSRASILTGQYPHNHDNRHVQPPLGGFAKFRDEGREQSTVATWLQAAGYRTGLFGKYLNGYPAPTPDHVPPGWTTWVGGYDAPPGYPAVANARYFNYWNNENGRAVFYGDRPEDYETDVIAAKVVSFIRDDGPGASSPFFVYWAPFAPHADRMPNGPPTPAPRHREAFLELSAPRTPSFNEADVSAKPPPIARQPLLNDEQIKYIDHVYRTRLQSLLAVDEALQRIVQVLTERGELANTYIFFTSDNGFHLGQHRGLPGKNEVYEEDIRVPLIVRGPGIPAGVTREHLVLNSDFASTFAELAGTPAADFVDGRSLVPLLRATPLLVESWRRDFLVELYRPPAAGGEAIRALRTLDTKYVEYASGPRELYDLSADPDELVNLYSSASPERLAALAERLAALANCAAATCHP